MASRNDDAKVSLYMNIPKEKERKYIGLCRNISLFPYFFYQFIGKSTSFTNIFLLKKKTEIHRKTYFPTHLPGNGLCSGLFNTKSGPGRKSCPAFFEMP